MTSVEDRLIAAMAERADGIAASPDSWTRNQQLLQRRSASTTARRYRAPLLVAATVLLLIVSVVTVRSQQHTAAPVAPSPIGNADGVGCGFRSLPGGTGEPATIIYAQPETSGDRKVVLLQGSGKPSACFFDGVGWHHAAGSVANLPIQVLEVSTADGQSYLWGLLGSGAYETQIIQDGGPTSTLSTTGSNYGSAPFITQVSSSGTVRVLNQAGKVLATQSFDLAKATTSPAGPVVQRTSTWNSTGAGGTAIACPAGEADATAVQPVPGAAAVTLALHTRGAAGEPVVCASGGLTSIAGVVTGFSGLDAMVIHNVDSSPRLWGVLPDKVATLVITTKGVGTSTFVADPAKAVDGAVEMSTLGNYRTFAAVAVLEAGASQFQLYAADGTSITRFQL